MMYLYHLWTVVKKKNLVHEENQTNIFKRSLTRIFLWQSLTAIFSDYSDSIIVSLTVHDPQFCLWHFTKMSFLVHFFCLTQWMFETWTTIMTIISVEDNFTSSNDEEHLYFTFLLIVGYPSCLLYVYCSFLLDKYKWLSTFTADTMTSNKDITCVIS